VRRLGQHRAERIGNERAAPEFQAALGRSFVAHAVDGRHVDAVGDRVRALDGAPGVVLGRAELGLLGVVPADGGGIEQHLRAAERGDAGGFGQFSGKRCYLFQVDGQPLPSGTRLGAGLHSVREMRPANRIGMGLGISPTANDLILLHCCPKQVLAL
jgi:hypothetical protein